MPQLLLIKDANTAIKKIGDIIGVFEDAHKFSQEEINYFHIEYVAGFKSALELKLFFNTLMEIKTAVRLPEGNKWTFDQPEEKEFWRELPDGRWCELVSQPKRPWNYYALTSEERKQLAEPILTLEQRKELLARCENRIKAQPENLIELPDLNTVHI